MEGGQPRLRLLISYPLEMPAKERRVRFGRPVFRYYIKPVSHFTFGLRFEYLRTQYVRFLRWRITGLTFNWFSATWNSDGNGAHFNLFGSTL
jgi:hypothetical protein